MLIYAGPIFEGVPDFSGTCCLLQICRYWSELTFCAISAKSQDSKSRKWPKKPKMVNFGHLDLFLKVFQIFREHVVFCKCRYWSELTFCTILAKSQDSNLSNWPKTLKNGHFDPKRAKMAKFFSKNPAVSLFLLYCPLTSCKKSEKSLERFLSKVQKTSILDKKLLIKKI